MKKKTRSYKHIPDGIQTEHKQSLEALATNFLLYYKCGLIAYWLMTSHTKKGYLFFNICSRVINNQRISIESDHQHANLNIYLNNSLKVKYQSRKLITFIPSEELFCIIDVLYDQAQKKMRENHA